MTKHRVFIAINLPSAVKRVLLSCQRQWANLPVRWTTAENLHITFVFLGYLEHDEVAALCRSVRSAVQSCPSFDIKFDKICLGPPQGPPRLIWAEGAAGQELVGLRQKLVDASAEFLHAAQAGRQFKVHITLARLRRGESIAFKEQPLSLTVPVLSVEVMESFLSRKGPEYTVLESIELGGD